MAVDRINRRWGKDTVRFAVADPEGRWRTKFAGRIVRTMAAHVAPGEFERAGPEVREMLLANVPAFRLDYDSRRSSFTLLSCRVSHTQAEGI